MTGRRSGWLRGSLILTVVVWAAWPQPARVAAAPPPQARGPFQYTGAGSCAASSCHGSIVAKHDTPISQNEYSIWIVSDKHSKAYAALSNPVSLQIARNLGMKERPDTSPQCLVCHALNVPAELRAHTFDLSDGVSCELCHGPASAWLGPHTTRGWTHAQSVALGMKDTKNLRERSRVCLSCHLGTADRQMTHEFLAAGHPDLTFELDSYSAVMPRHWKEPESEDPWYNVRQWSVGEAVQMREALQQLARRAQGPQWPEYTELDCFACHHSLTKPEDSWRQQLGYPGRRPGVPAWSQARYLVFRQFLQQVQPSTASQLGAALDQVAAQMNQLQPDRNQVASAAGRAAELADQVSNSLAGQHYDAALTLRLLRSFTDHGDELGAQERSAEQAAMAVDSLYVAYARNTKPANAAQVDAAINDLFRQMENPSAYDPRRFTDGMRRVNLMLGGPGAP